LLLGHVTRSCKFKIDQSGTVTLAIAILKFIKYYKGVASPTEISKDEVDVLRQGNSGATEVQRSGFGRLKILALLPVALVIVQIFVAAFSDSDTVFEPPYLLTVLNILFLTAVPFAIAYLAWRDCRETGQLNLLMIGCAMVSFGFGSLLAGFAGNVAGGQNLVVTVHNTGALLAAALLVIAAVLSLLKAPQYKLEHHRALYSGTGYLAIVVLISLLAIVSYQNLFPTFFVQGSGPTVLRQVVLGTATLLFAIAAAIFIRLYMRSRTDFSFWFGIALILITIGLSAIFIQKNVGSIMGWTGRAAQYIGCIYIFIAIIAAQRVAKIKKMPLATEFARSFNYVEANYRMLVEMAGDAIISVDNNGFILSWNPAAARIFGYSEAEAIGAKVIDFIFPRESALSLNSELQKLAKPKYQFAKPTNRLETMAKRKQGEIFPAEVSLAIKNIQGKWLGTFIIRDLTDRKKTEEALQQSENRLKGIVQAAPIGIGVVINRVFVDMNDKFCEMLGYSRNELMNQSARMIYASDDDYTYVGKAKYDQIAQKGLGSVETRFKQKNGQMLDVILSSAPLDKADISKGVIFTVQDITERKKAEQMLRESKSQFKNIVEHITDIFFMLDSNREMIYVSPGIERALGYTVEEMLKNWRSYLTDNPVNLAGYEKTTLALDTGEKQEPYLMEFKHRDGTKRLVEINESPFKNDKGEVIGIVGAARDISEREKAEKALRDSEEKYRSVVENAREAIYVAVDGVIKFANSRAGEISGYSLEEISSRPFTEFIHPDDRDLVADRYLRRLQGEDLPHTYSFRILDKAGNLRWVELTAVVINWEGKPATLNFLTDITTRKQLEERTARQNAVRHSVSRIFEETLRCNTDEEVACICLSVAQELSGSKFGWIGEVNANGLLDTIAISDPGCESCRMPQSQATKAIRNMPVRGIWGRVLKDGESLITNNPAGHPDSVGLPPGHPGLTAFLGVPVKHAGQTIGMIALANKPGGYDTDDREAVEELSAAFEEALRSKRADQAIIRSKLLLQTVIDSTPDWIYIKDFEHKYLLVNKSFADAQHTAPQDMIGKADTDFFAEELCLGNPDKGITGYHTDDLQAFQGHIVHNPSNFITWADGSIHIYDTYKIPLTDQAGKIYAVMVYSRDITERHVLEAEREYAYDMLSRTLQATIDTIARIVEMRDPYTAGHQQRVAALCLAIAEKLDMNRTGIEHLSMAAKIHDIGKMFVPSDILSKPGKLSAIEWQLIKTHPQHGYDIIKDMEFERPVGVMVLQHHERLDGSGYPSGLKDGEILLESKILAVADVVEAICSHRPYRPALNLDKALEEIARNKGTLYDPDVVDACLSVFKEGQFKFVRE